MRWLIASVFFILILGGLSFADQSPQDQAPQDQSPQSETEAGAPCAGEACEEKTSEEKKQIEALCLKSLPPLCQEIVKEKPEYTICTGVDDSADELVGYTVLECVKGLGLGGIDSLFRAGQILAAGAKGAFRLGSAVVRLDGEYFAEAYNTVSMLVSELADEDGDKKLREMLTSGIHGSIDEFVECLNYRGRWEYFCEGTIQTLAALIGVAYVNTEFWKLQQRVKLMAVGVKGTPKVKLSSARKVQQREELKQLWLGKSINGGSLSPYQLSLLTPKQISSGKVRFSNFDDKTAIHLNSKQLNSIPNEFLEKANIAGLSNTLPRFSHKKFEVLMNNPSAVNMPHYDILKNIKKIPPDKISTLQNAGQVPIKNFSVQQIRSLSPSQVIEMSKNNVNDIGRLSVVKRRAFQEQHRTAKLWQKEQGL